MTFHDRGTSWFLAQLKPNCANIADKNLKRQGDEVTLADELEHVNAYLHIEQARAQVQQRGLAAARGAHQRQHAAGRKRQAHAAEHLGQRVAVAHVLQ